MSLLEIDSIQKSYNGNKILRSIVLHVKTSDIVSIIGRNGSGKTTLFDVIFGSTSAEQKFVRIDGEVKKNTFEIKQGISFATQFNHFPKNLKVSKLINLFFTDDFQKKLFLDDNVIDEIIKNRVKDLSYGTLRYLQVKLYLFSDSKFCILDEPFAGLSPILINKISNFIVEQSKNKGIIISDHQFDYVMNIATRNHYLKNGVLIEIKDRNDLIKVGYIKN
ncbi:ABC-type multidrug transport system, ATPase component [Chishuiella changwenlii]|uniref:ABC transporter ATP-binding protein n=1 Tax=Chishuiella changwenlii TaxID=1434701 RepID=A0A1M6SZ00_9FLAO|nr:ATP-binding cassette domain-containing protein [Chishuiella changwenlii]GGE94247.1 ABC transporter ATP-binding protein [Chishuiella changwenlii]SHK49890.1 ABC-type multidrug transport system, ATPase component [Chishuiella changwenlii]